MAAPALRGIVLGLLLLPGAPGVPLVFGVDGLLLIGGALASDVVPPAGAID